MPTYSDGRHEHGQNYLNDKRIIRRITNLVADTSGPILEIGPGDGALTLPLSHLNRHLKAVEIHPEAVRRLQKKLRHRAHVVNADVLDYRLPSRPHVLVGNLPFHLTTAILRKLLHDQHWSQAVLITQWEVARRRAGVGGSTMMTAQWALFYEFGLAGRIPASAYTPSPTVDGGLLTITRREQPLLPWTQRKDYAGFVHAVFTGSGRNIGMILRGVLGLSKAEVGRLCGAISLRTTALPKDISAAQWAELYARAAQKGWQTRHRPRRGSSGLSKQRKAHRR